MGGFFNMEGGFMSTISKIFDICLISIIWSICCIPIVTAGAATTALYYSIVKVVRHERGYLTKEYFKSFKLNFKNATLCWIAIIALCVLFYFNVNFARQDIGGNLGFLLMCIYRMLLFVILSVTVYIFPNLSRFSMNVRELAKNSLFMALKHLPTTILVDILVVATALVIWILPIATLALPAITCLLCSFLIERVLKKYMPDPSEDLGKDEWYLE